MYYRSFRKPFNPNGKHHVRHDNISERLLAILNSGELEVWQVKKVRSFCEFWEQYKCLTRKQYTQLRRFEQWVKDAPERNKEKAKTEEKFKSNEDYNKVLNLLSEPTLTKWEKDFLSSVKEQFLKKGILSPKQLTILNKVADKYSDEKKEQAKAWKESFSPLQQKIFKVCVQYYKELNKKLHTDYYSNILQNAVEAQYNGEEYIPTESEYFKLCQNKRSKRIAQYVEQGQKFAEGTLCRLCANFGSTPMSRAFGYTVPNDSVVIVVGIDYHFETTAKGCLPYTVFVPCQNKTIRIEERNLKKA